MAMAGKTIDVKIDTLKFNRHLTALARKQIPFATALSLTTTAKDVQADTRDQIRDSMTVRRKGVLAGVGIRAARKSDGLTRMSSEVGHRDWYMKEQMGNKTVTRRPASGQFLMIPRAVRKSKKASISKGRRPRPLVEKPKFFLKKTDGNRTAVYQRYGTKKKPKLRLMYSGTTKQTINPKFNFYDHANRTIRRSGQRNFNRAMGKALKAGKR